MSTQWPKSCAMKILKAKKKMDKKYGVKINSKTEFAKILKKNVT